MEALSMPRMCSHSAMRQISVSQCPRRTGRRACSGSQTQRRFSGQVLQCARLISSLVIPPSSSINGQKRLVGAPAFHVERRSAERSSLSRLNEELVRRTVRAEKEPNNKDDGEKPAKANQSDRQLWIDRARNMQTAVQVFGSTMFWIILFFVASIWDVENNWVRNGRKNRGRGHRK